LKELQFHKQWLDSRIPPAHNCVEDAHAHGGVMGQLLIRIGREGSIATFNPEKVTDPAIEGWLFQDFAVVSGSSFRLSAP
jgi:hypothetical protein